MATAVPVAATMSMPMAVTMPVPVVRRCQCRWFDGADVDAGEAAMSKLV
ncbi:MAG: hypothetical protein OXU62_06905 [Gammaproteobacteria bacterium]|nr:hypothetical protein [Gammaproteobacteria bacterium]